MSKIYHIGLAVPDLQHGMQQLGALFDLTWRPIVSFSAPMTGGDGRQLDITINFTFSRGGPFSLEVWQSIPDTPLATPESGWFHHIGYWVDDVAKERDRLNELGHPSVLNWGENLLVHRGPGHLMVEPVNSRQDWPYLRDLFPAGSPFAGEPDFSKAQWQEITGS